MLLLRMKLYCVNLHTTHSPANAADTTTVNAYKSASVKSFFQEKDIPFHNVKHLFIIAHQNSVLLTTAFIAHIQTL